MTVAIEDAGFEIRDSLHWIYGSGFPKGQDVSKAIDKAAGAERKVIGDKLDRPGYHLHGHDSGTGCPRPRYLSDHLGVAPPRRTDHRSCVNGMRSAGRDGTRH
jgi:hypothetical protein